MGAREEAPLPGMPDLDQVRAAFPQFEILECIGRGGMGAVYRARQPQLDRLVALKILLPGLERDPGFPERFAREARALAKLNHPSIVGVHDFGETGGFFWLTMEHVDGVNLRQAMQAARFTPAQALAIIPELCAALQYAHDHGVLHRDIKPENILLDARGKVKVADFGIARMAGDERLNPTLTMTGAALGTAAYVAPEQIENPRAVDHRADLYSLGVVLYEMLTGELPLGRFPPPSERSASDPRLDEVVFRSLEKQPEKRYQQAEEFSNRVSGVAATSPQPTLPGPQAKFSVAAVAAAATTAFSVILGVPYISNLAWARVGGSQTGFTTLDLLLILIGIVAPALTGMILGAVSWVRIKDSAGALRGTPLARFATLAWPVLIVLAVIPGRQMVIAGLLLAGIIYLIVRAISGARRVAPSRVARAQGGPTSTTLIAASIGAILIGSIILGFGVPLKSILLMIPGLCFTVPGVAGGWWALWRMKQGTSSTAGYTALKIFAVWLPVLAIAGFLIMFHMDDGMRPFRGKGDYFVNLASLYLLCFVVARLAFGLSRLPGKARPQPWVTGVVALLALVLAAISLGNAKFRDGKWPAAHAWMEESVFIPEPLDGQRGPEAPASPVALAMREAAGEYRDKIRIQGGDGNWQIGIMAHDRAELKEHWLAFRQRLFTLLPVESLVRNHTPLNPMLIEAQISDSVNRHTEIPLDFLVFAAASAVLAGWCIAPLAFSCAALSLAACAALAWAPVWRVPGDRDEMLLTGPPLPPLAFQVKVRDFSSPEAAARTVYQAARAGDMELMKQGMSTRLRAAIDKRGVWKSAMERLAEPTKVSVYGNWNPYSETASVFCESIAYGNVQRMQYEDGAWRLDDLPFDVSTIE